MIERHLLVETATESIRVALGFTPDANISYHVVMIDGITVRFEVKANGRVRAHVSRDGKPCRFMKYELSIQLDEKGYFSWPLRRRITTFGGWLDLGWVGVPTEMFEFGGRTILTLGAFKHSFI